MNLRENIETLSDLEIGLVNGANGEGEITIDLARPHDICDWWWCRPPV